MTVKKRILIMLLAVPICISAAAQDISQIAKSDPLLISGAVGTNNTYYHSSSGNGYTSPLSNSIFANLNMSIYGVSLPFSFYYSNNNTSFSYPYFSFNISPSYKNWTLHIGTHSMPFSNYIYNIPFNGVGLEYSGHHIRFGAFYGQLRRAINDDPTDVEARNPQYARNGWGLKLGYGSNASYIDIYLFEAKDRQSSLNEIWQEKIKAQENLAIGLRGCLTLKKYFSFTANIAASAFNTDRTATVIENEDLKKFGSIFNAKYSALLRFAGDVGINFSSKGFGAVLLYKMIQPDYTTLGMTYSSNNMHSVGISANKSLLKGRLMLSGNFSGQSDNLSGNQLYTTKGFVYSVNATGRISEKFMLNAMYNGYRQLQSDGTAVVNDSVRIDRIMHGITVSPTYTIDGKSANHTLSASINYNNNKDLNKFSEGLSDVKTLAIGTNYDMSLKNINWDFMMSLSHQSSKSYISKYTTDLMSVGASHSIGKENPLSLNANFELGMNKLKGQSTNLSLGASASASYTLKKSHVFSMSASYNKFKNYNISDDLSYNGSDYTISLNYTYTFSLLQIKRKAKDGSKAEK